MVFRSCRDPLKTMPKMFSHHRRRDLSTWLSGYNVDIQVDRQQVSVQSKKFANDSFDPVSGYRIPNLF
jgi:hypothetical protein